MNLHDLIIELEKRDRKQIVDDGFGIGMSWRGSYTEAAFQPVMYATIGDMLDHAVELLDSTQDGYLMHGCVDVHIAGCGDCGEPINSFNFKYWDSQK